MHLLQRINYIELSILIPPSISISKPYSLEKNPIDNLSIEQIQGIYTGDIVNWSEVGGWDCELHPYVRNRNSGSQEKFETMVMLRLATHSEYVTSVL